MLSHGIEHAKYGVQTTFYWFFEDVTATDAPFIGVAPVTADIFISKDGGAPATATNAMTAIGNGIYSHVMTAAEMSATRISVSVYDQTASEIYKPACRVIITKLQLGQIDVDATQIGGNTEAIKAQGVGSGEGLKATGGLTGHGISAISGTTSGDGLHAEGGTGSIGNGISAVAGSAGGSGINCEGRLTGRGLQAQGGATGAAIYAIGGGTSGDGIQAVTQAGNSNGVSAGGRGTGQGLYITHATDNSLMTNLFDTLEGSEPSAAIASNATIKSILQNLKRRFFNLVTQTSSVQTMFKDDSVTSLQTMACSNDGTTQSKGKAS